MTYDRIFTAPNNPDDDRGFIISHRLLRLAATGPWRAADWAGQVTQNSRFRITPEDVARIRAYFELDLVLPVRFSRWLIGEPRGPIMIGSMELFANLKIGCRIPLEQSYVDSSGHDVSRVVGCQEGQSVYLRSLAGRKVSRGILFGDFGNSWTISRDRPVSTLLASRIPYTVELIGLSTLLALIIGIPIGIYSAVKQYSRFDYTFTGMAFIGSAMPTFFFGLLMILFFSIIPYSNGWFYLPPGSATAARDYLIPGLGNITAGSTGDKLLHLVLPVAVLTIVSVAGWSRYIRASMLEVMRQDYIRTARAKGLLERVVIIKHALRNGLIPFITIIVFALPGLFGGAIITESIFNWPGMGRLYFTALGQYDYPVAMAMLFITAVLTVLATLLRDILYTVVDPRIRFS
jgi:peptide/nickel transport system permease protein